MSVTTLGRLEQIDLREIWKHEARGFSSWLSKEENITLLSETIGIEIEVEETEAKVGSFSVDILARDLSNESKIIIENQLEQTDHDHLGKLITYASGFDARTIIWIVKKSRDEHRKAIEWLNNHLDDEINLFLLEIELWKIGDSLVAPKFNIIESPNSWAKRTKKNQSINKVITDVENLRLDFWTKFKEYCLKNAPTLKMGKPHLKDWYNINADSKDYHIVLRVSISQKVASCEIYIGNNKILFKKFLSNQKEIEEQLGFNLEWKETTEKLSKIIIRTDFDLNDSKGWNEIFRWLATKSETFKEVFLKVYNLK